MKKEKKIKINYIRYIKKQYVPSTPNLKTWIHFSLMKSFINHVNLIFVGQKRMRTLNSKYLKKDKSTIFNSENIKNFYLSSSMSPSIKFNFKEVKL